MAQLRELVLGTAGHIDHGKSSLVRALTGHDPDRLPEEKKRGITIELGFAPWLPTKGIRASFVDVPGHEAFVRTMVSGAAGMDAVVIVVSAEDGVMPQTREHLAICHLLGVREAIIALTKIDRLEGDEDAVELAREDVAEALADTPYASAPIVPVSAHNGDGMETFKSTLLALCRKLAPRAAKGAPCLSIDRVFTLKGHGTVVTGTLVAGRVRVEDRLRLWSGQAQQAREGLRVRGMQVRGEAVESARAGNRCALNLGGMEAKELHRGDVLCAGLSVANTQLLHARVQQLSHGDRAWDRKTALQLVAGSSSATAHLEPIGEQGDRSSIAPGQGGWVRIRLESPLPLWPGQRFVLREFSSAGAVQRGLSVGGGQVLDPRPGPSRGRRNAWPDLLTKLERRHAEGDLEPALVALCEAEGIAGIPGAELCQRLGIDELSELPESAQLLRLGGRYFAAALLGELKDRLVKAVAAFHDTHPLQPGMSRAAAEACLPLPINEALAHHACEQALRDGTLMQVDERGNLAIPGRGKLNPEALPAPMAQVLSEYQRGGITPPTLKDLETRTGLSSKKVLEIASLLQQSELLIRVSPELSFSPQAHEQVLEAVRAHLSQHGTIDVQALKALTGLSRKFVVPFLEHLDRLAVTRREGDLRVPGPRA